MSEGQLPTSALKIAPMDAPYVSAMSVDFRAILPAVADILEATDTRAMTVLPALEALCAQFLGCDIRHDIFENLGPDVVIAQTATDTSAPLSFMPCLVWSIPVKNDK